METIFEACIPADSIVWSWKWNDGICPEEYVDAIYDYVWATSNITVYATSYGYHEQGKSEKPHSHLTFITATFPLKPVTCNPTDHRKKWCLKNGKPADFFKGKVSVKIVPLDPSKPRYYPLAYPLKERKRLAESTMFILGKKGRRPMKPEEVMFLEEVGASLFDASKSKDEAREKSDKKQCNQKEELLAFCIKERKNFSNLQEMRVYLDDAYLRKLEFSERPDLQNFKKYCLAVAFELGIFKASDL